MTAIDEIQAAIDKLTKLRDESTQPTGSAAWYQGRNSRRYEADDEVFSGPDENTPGSSDIITCVKPADAELIVTLHATIDAQLAILRAGRTASVMRSQARHFEEIPGWAAEASALAMPLAHAINGTA